VSPHVPDSLTAELPIAPDHGAYAGHFPGSPILPGAVLLDEALYEIGRSRGVDLARWRLASAKFLDIVRPGDGLRLTHAAQNGTIRFSIACGGRMVASGLLRHGD